MTERIIKLVTKEADNNVVGIVEDILEKSKKGEIVAVICCYATHDNWERVISAGTPMLEALGQLEVIKAELAREYFLDVD